MNIRSFPQETDNQSLAALVKPIPKAVRPNDEFVYWTRRMLVNVMSLSSVDAVDAPEADAIIGSREAA